MVNRRYHLYKHLPTIVAIAGLSIVIGGTYADLPPVIIGGLLVLASFAIVGGTLLIGFSHSDFL